MSEDGLCLLILSILTNAAALADGYEKPNKVRPLKCNQFQDHLTTIIFSKLFFFKENSISRAVIFCKRLVYVYFSLRLQ